MKEVIRIEIQPEGATQVFIAQSRDDAASASIWSLYRALRPQISALERLALKQAKLIQPEAKRT